MLAIAALYVFKMILVNVIEINIYKDIHKALNESVWLEHLLMKLENVEDTVSFFIMHPLMKTGILQQYACFSKPFFTQT